MFADDLFSENLGKMPCVEAKNFASVSSALSRLSSEYSFLKTECIGRSVMGKPILAASLGTGENSVLISAAHHANEWVGTQVMMCFIEQLCRAYVSDGELFGVLAKDILACSRLYLVPLVNPDGVDLAQGKLASGGFFKLAKCIALGFPHIPFPQGWKANINGIDLNLQYPAGWEQAKAIKFSQGYDRPAPRDYVGDGPLCAPESIALARYTRKISPGIIIALHSQGEVIYWKYSTFEPTGSRELGQSMSEVSGYELFETPAESGNAGYKDWFIKEFDRPGYTLELGLGENPLPEAQLPKIYADTAPMLIRAALWNCYKA